MQYASVVIDDLTRESVGNDIIAVVSEAVDTAGTVCKSW